jgi:hypothetical protein
MVSARPPASGEDDATAAVNSLMRSTSHEGEELDPEGVTQRIESISPPAKSY